VICRMSINPTRATIRELDHLDERALAERIDDRGTFRPSADVPRARALDLGTTQVHRGGAEALLLPGSLAIAALEVLRPS